MRYKNNEIPIYKNVIENPHEVKKNDTHELINRSPSGPKGIQVEQNVSPSGPRGVCGNKGMIGPKGLCGKRGHTGPPGPRGLPGPQESKTIFININREIDCGKFHTLSSFVYDSNNYTLKNMTIISESNYIYGNKIVYRLVVKNNDMVDSVFFNSDYYHSERNMVSKIKSFENDIQNEKIIEIQFMCDHTTLISSIELNM